MKFMGKMRKTDGIYIYKNEGWFVGRNDGILYIMDLQTMTVCPYFRIQSTSDDCFRGYQKCVVDERFVVCMPDHAKDFVIIYRNDKQLKRIVIKETCERLSVLNGWIVGDEFWCVSEGMNKVVKINLQNFKYTMFDVNLGEIGCECKMYGDNIVMPCRNKAAVLRFNISLQMLTEEKIGVEDEGFNTVAIGDNQEIILTGHEKKVYIVKNGKVTEINIPDEYFQIIDGNNKDGKSFFLASYYRLGKLVLLPWKISCERCRDVVCVDVSDGNVSELYDDLEDDIFCTDEMREYEKLLIYKDGVALWVCDLKECKLEKLEVFLDLRAEVWKVIFENGAYSKEEESDLRLFLNFVCDKVAKEQEQK